MQLTTNTNPYARHANGLIADISTLINSAGFGETANMAEDQNHHLAVSISLTDGKSLTFILIPNDDTFARWSLECTTADMTRTKHMMKTTAWVLDYIKKELSTLEYTPSYTSNSLAKAKEPIQRDEVDEEAPDQDELNAARTTMEAELLKSREDTEADDKETKAWDAAQEYNKNLVKTFPRGEVKTGTGHTTDMGKVAKQTPADGKVKWNKEAKTEETETLNEGLKWNFDRDLGAVITPRNIPSVAMQRRSIVPDDPRKDDMRTRFMRAAGLSGQKI